MNTVDSIEWKGPYAMYPGEEFPLVFDADEAQVPGVYLWVVRQTDGYLPLYVGMSTRNIAWRQGEHVEGFLAGKYWIYNAELLKNGKRDYVRDYDPKMGISAFLNDYENLSSQVIEQLRIIQVFIAPIQSDKRFLERVESSLIELYWESEVPAEERFLDNARLSVSIPKADRIAVSVAGDALIRGMPSELDV